MEIRARVRLLSSRARRTATATVVAVGTVTTMAGVGGKRLNHSHSNNRNKVAVGAIAVETMAAVNAVGAVAIKRRKPRRSISRKPNHNLSQGSSLAPMADGRDAVVG
jgi:hypothetical protein